MNKQWTDPYLGMTHLYGGDSNKRRAAVQDNGSWFELSKWWPGCGFEPKFERFDSLDLAKQAGEAWVCGL